MDRHRHNIFLVNIRKLLSSIPNVHHYTETGSGENYTVLFTCVLQVTSSIERAEAMSEFQRQISVWLLAHRGYIFEALRSAALDLAQEWFNS